MIYSTSEHPQYVGVWPIEGEMKDRFLYRNQNLKTKTSIQIVFLKKADVCYLLCIRNEGLLEIFKIAITYLKYNEFSYIAKAICTRTFVKFKADLEHTTNLTELQIISFYLSFLS